MTRSFAPSGEQFDITAGDQRAVVVEVGGGLRSYTVDGRDVVAGYRDDELCPSGRGQILAPWPNRIDGGSYEYAGVSHQLPLNEPEAHNAIHGLVRWSTWTVRERDTDRIVLTNQLHPQPGYPFSLALTAGYRLSGSGLAVTMTATNTGGETCPYGSGSHPYIAVESRVDAALLEAAGRTVLISDERGLPIDSLPVIGTDYDFRTPRSIGATVLDHCFTDLERDDRAVAHIRIRDHDAEIAVWFDTAYEYLMLFTGDPLPDVARRALAVEPMTCPPNAFRTGTSVIHLAPGASHTATWGITPNRH